MKQLLPRSLIVGFIFFVIALVMVWPVFAQEGERPQVALSVIEASPGATIEIAGSYFEPDVLVTFILIQNGTQVEVGTNFADYHGDFTAAAYLPIDLQYGQYDFQAVDEKGRMAIAPLAIIPDPGGQEGGELRDEDDPLLAPMPTFAPGVVPGGVIQAAPQRTAKEVPAPSNNSLITMEFVFLLGILAIVGLRIVRKG